MLMLTFQQIAARSAKYEAQMLILCSRAKVQADCCLSMPAAQESIDRPARLQASPAKPSAAPAARTRRLPAFLTKQAPA